MLEPKSLTMVLCIFQFYLFSILQFRTNMSRNAKCTQRRKVQKFAYKYGEHITNFKGLHSNYARLQIRIVLECDQKRICKKCW